jgi:hypothetical protein
MTEGASVYSTTKMCIRSCVCTIVINYHVSLEAFKALHVKHL